MSLSTPVVQLIDRDPVAIEVSQKLSEAARALSGRRFHHLPVVDEGRLVGMLSASDMLKLGAVADAGENAAYMQALDRSYTLKDVMQKDVITVTHMATVGDVAHLLSAGGFHSVAVVDPHEHLLGVVTTTDLVGHMLDAEPHSEVPAAVQERLRELEHVLKAVQSYLHSGMAVQEHERLERAIEAARSRAA